MIVACCVEGIVNDPPASPLAGDCYIVGGAPTGDWAGHAGAVAGWTAGGWRFVAPLQGMRVTVKPSGLIAAYHADAWEIGQVRGDAILVAGTKVVGAQSAAIAPPVGGTVVDAQARAAIGSILAAMRGHGLIVP